MGMINRVISTDFIHCVGPDLNIVEKFVSVSQATYPRHTLVMLDYFNDRSLLTLCALSLYRIFLIVPNGCEKIDEYLELFKSDQLKVTVVLEHEEGDTFRPIR